MADIIQAAKWMQEGKRVRRPSWRADEGFYGRIRELDVQNSYWISYFCEEAPPQRRSPRKMRYTDLLTTADLLATDWQIAEPEETK